MPPYLPGMFYDPSFPMGGVPPMSFQPSFYSLPGGPPQSTLAAFPVPIPFPIPVPTGSSSSPPPPPPLPVSPAPAPPTAPLPTVPPPTPIETQRSRMHSMADMMMNTMMEQFRAQLRGKKRKSARFSTQLPESEESSEEEEEVVPPCPADLDYVTEAPQVEESEGIPVSENIANNTKTTEVPMDQSPPVSNKDPVGILSRKKKYVIPVAQNPLPPSVDTSRIEQEVNHQTAFKDASCLKYCFCVLVFLLLMAIILANAIYVISPIEVSNFLCVLLFAV
ncbi:hypothetical protein HPB47_028210 [Ixodes persulcatus]|uniref:Uncharacterized protein n=1 Tax=Ixodes persulcatus TaxID=34615 RepID=A0AC60PTU2_IXOPE|nr:hypothetical protein HPB47_028210 [Ixodes persulcatus]